MFIGIVFSIILLTWHFVEKTPEREKSTPTKIEVRAATISKGRLIKDGEHPAIQVTIKNNTNKVLDTIRGHIDLYDSHGLFGNCWENLKNFEPNEEKDVVIECWAFKTGQLPNDTIIKTRVRYVWVQAAS